MATASHTHDDRYYTETEIDTTLEEYSLKIHSHSEYALTETMDDVLLRLSDLETKIDNLFTQDGTTLTINY